MLMCLALMCVMAVGVQAGTVDVFGYTWTTNDGGGTPGYTVNSPTSLTMSSNGGSAGMWFMNDDVTNSGLTLGVGDVLSYDRYIEGTASLPDPGFNSKPLADSGSSLVGNFESSYRNNVPNPYVADKWSYVKALGGWNDISPGSQETGLHFEFTFVSDQEFYAEVTDIVTDTVVASGTGWIFDDSSVLGDIGGWYMYVENTTNDATIENFVVDSPTVRPIPTTPTAGDVGVPLDQVISWTVNDATYVAGYDVYFADNEPKVVSRDSSVQVGTNQPGTSYTPPADLELDQTYFVRVDTNIIPGADPDDALPGSTVWSFTTIGPPQITLGSVLTAMSLLPADLAAVVVDVDNDVNSVSWEVLTDDLLYPAGAIASVTDTTTVDLYAPAATFTTDTEGAYKVRLTVNDLAGSSVESIAHIDVYGDACQAAQVAASWAGFSVYDADTDCDVDIFDCAQFALKWLDDINLAAQETYTGVPVYIPIVN